MARKMPYTNFHDLNLDWIIKRIQNVYNDENPPPYPVRTVNGQVGNVHLTGDDIPVSPNDNTEVSTALASKYVKPAGGIPESDLAPGIVNHLLMVRMNINANTGNTDSIFGTGKYFIDVTFSNNAKVIEYNSPQINNYRGFSVTINSNRIDVSVTIKPNTNASYIDLIIANVTEVP